MTRKIAPKLTHVIEMAWRYDRRFDDAEIEGALRELRALLAVAKEVDQHFAACTSRQRTETLRKMYDAKYHLDRAPGGKP